MIHPYKNRMLNDIKPVRVYRNLHNGLYSIQQKVSGRYIVVGHADKISLCRVSFEVNENGRQRVLTEKRKNVHAFVIGYLANTPARKARTAPIMYNPYKAASFTYKATGEAVSRVSRVTIDQSGIKQIIGA